MYLFMDSSILWAYNVYSLDPGMLQNTYLIIDVPENLQKNLSTDIGKKLLTTNSTESQRKIYLK